MAARRLRPLVARADELDLLVGAVSEAADGRPSVTVVRGDAGIGKSRLVLELCAGPPLPGVVVLRGDCFRVDAGELPFAPLAAALRDAGSEALSGAVGEVSIGARRQLGRMFPHVFATVDPAQPLDSDRHAQRQLFDALLSLLDARLVGFLARSVRTERLATVVTYRSDALPPSESDGSDGRRARRPGARRGRRARPVVGGGARSQPACRSDVRSAVRAGACISSSRMSP